MFTEAPAGKVGRAPSAIKDEIDAGIEVGTIPASMSESIDAGMPDGKVAGTPDGRPAPNGRVPLKRDRLCLDASTKTAVEAVEEIPVSTPLLVGETPVDTPVPLIGYGGCGSAEAAAVRTRTANE